MNEPLLNEILALATPETLAKLTDAEYEQIAGLLPQKTPDLCDRAHVWQTRMVEDDWRFLVVCGTRRSGKTYGACVKQVRTALSRPGTAHIFLGLTHDSAKRNAWEPCFKDIDNRFGLNLKFNEATSEIRFPNGSIIYVKGADATDWQRKLRGAKFASIIVDESQDFGDLEALVIPVLRPTLIDLEGWLMLEGTPGQVPIGFFYELTKDVIAENASSWRVVTAATEWQGYAWAAKHNPHVARQVADEIADWIKNDPDIVNRPEFKREYRGMWVTDDDRRVYRYMPNRNDYDVLPKYAYGHWHHVLGVDLGFNDDTAMTLAAWHDNDPCMYVIAAEKMPGLDITATANWIREWQDTYRVETIVVDGANKQAVEEMRRRHNLPLIAADKREKAEFIDMMNADFARSRIKWGPQCGNLREESAKLTWESRAWAKGRRVEDPRADNHQLDSHLYLWRYTYSYLSQKHEETPRVGTPEYADWMESKSREALERGLRQHQPDGDDAWL